MAGLLYETGMRVNQHIEEVMKDMRDPLAVERAEVLKLIDRLDEIVDRLRDVDARVSSEYADELQRLRKQIMRTRSPERWRVLLNFVLEVLARIAAEVLLRALM